MLRHYYQRLQQRRRKASIYTKQSLKTLLPRRLAKQQFLRDLQEFEHLPNDVKAYLQQRVAYYCHPHAPFATDADFVAADDFRLAGHNSAYYFDLAVLLRYFSPQVRFAYEFGDVTTIPSRPCFVKSRPIDDGNDSEHGNAVLLKLNSIRHFNIPSDPYHYGEKIPQLVWRGAAYQAHRIQFLAQHHSNPLFDVGCTASRSADKPYHKNYLTVAEQQRYQFILSIEGNDVASNLKWIMASNSLCFMTRPRFETWFMEGTLIPDFHYVAVRDDYADLPEKVAFYQQNPQAAQTIIANAHAYLQPFLNHKQERLMQLLVMKRYFEAQQSS